MPSILNTEVSSATTKTMGTTKKLKNSEKVVGTVTILTTLTGQSVEEMVEMIRVGVLDALGGRPAARDHRSECSSYGEAELSSGSETSRPTSRKRKKRTRSGPKEGTGNPKIPPSPTSETYARKDHRQPSLQQWNGPDHRGRDHP